MTLNPGLWHWPQWVIITLMLLGLFTYIAMHGKPMQTTKGEPLKYNGFIKALTFLGWYYLLCQGGFFR